MQQSSGHVVVMAIAIAGTTVLALLVLPQTFGLEQTQGIAQLSAFRALATLTAALLALVCLGSAIILRGSRRILPFALTLVLAGISVTGALVTVGRGIDDRPAAGASTGVSGQITVLTWNVLGDAVSPGTIAAVAIGEGADVVALPESSAEAARTAAAAMTAAGRPMIAHSTGAGRSATSLLVSTGLGEYTLRAVDTGTTRALAQSETLIAEPVLGHGPTIVAVHTTAPRPDALAQWRAELADLASVCTPTADVILAGDFNATLDHLAPLRGSGDLGSCHDAAGAGAVAGLGTWPVDLPALLGTPIDHVMATPGWIMISARVLTEFDSSGSDHRPVVATLLPRTTG